MGALVQAELRGEGPNYPVALRDIETPGASE